MDNDYASVTHTIQCLLLQSICESWAYYTDKQKIFKFIKDVIMPSIKQAIKTSENTFEVTDVSVTITNAPNDCDWSRWGMLDDRKPI